ncbi:class IV adenylate cyclase [Natronosalvus vescus]|uniref:class IV adenylate cyclase n=1 Tax=Natronosalvus vescus TaxID=2953881 RepID=UPI0020913A2A|nr:class IV adenylate cyclase [Natronosalvus vescus]
MYEVELKVPAVLDDVRKRLEAAGADHESTLLQEDTYYDAPHRSFPETDEALRIRRESAVRDSSPPTVGAQESNGPTSGESGAHGASDTDSRLTYKGPLLEAESKTRIEHETTVGDDEAMDAALTTLGFEPAATVRKRRERYALEGYTITLDTVDGAGEFLEVEAEAETEADVESVREGAQRLLERLDLDPDEQIRTSYLELVLES